MISVIVPIYNVEKYLPRCLESLKRQTMADVEFILVDDGSTDHSGSIAEEYGDERFRVFHTQNHGLSAARNFGIDRSCGEWLMFVDGDDWVEPGFCDIPFRAAQETGADIVVFRSFHTTRHGIRRNSHFGLPMGAVSVRVAIENNSIAAWNKLYRRTLFNEIRYPEGMIYEDIATTHRLLYAADRIVAIPDRLYWHIHRRGSISHTFTALNRQDLFVANCLRYDFLLRHGLSASRAEGKLLRASLGVLASGLAQSAPVYRVAHWIVASAEGVPQEFTVIQKAAFMLCRWNEPLFLLCCRALLRTNGHRGADPGR